MTSTSPAYAQWVAVVAVFGAVWGAAESSLGALLRSAAIPIHGTVMAGIGIVIVLVGRRTLSAGHRQGSKPSGRAGRGAFRGRGSCFAMAIVAAVILPVSISRGIIPAMIGILIEAACLEIVLWFGCPGRGRFALAGLLAALVPPIQMIAFLAVRYGPAALITFQEIVLNKQGGAKLGLAGLTAGTLVVGALVASAVYGLVCGTLGWSLAGQILKRLGREAA